MTALGCGLADRGHHVAIAAARDFEDMIAAYGLDYEPIDASVADLSTSAAGRDWLGGQAATQRQELRAMQDFFAAAAPPIAQMLIRTSGYDHTVTTPFLLESALTLGRHSLTVAMLQPDFTTSDGRSTIAALHPGKSLVNRFAGHIYEQATRRFFASFAEATCRLSDRPRMSFRDYHSRKATIPHLLASSPAITPLPADNRLNATATGFWQHHTPEDFIPPEPLADFLESGPPPIYVGFGSMSSHDAATTAHLITDALRICGLRAVVHRGAADLDVANDMVLSVGSIPHSWLLPRVSAAVHHGGAGTTASAIVAGIPQVVIPHMGDQPFWGRRMHELGVAPPPIPRKGLDAAVLAAAMTATRDQDMRGRAARLGAVVAAEDGVSIAIAVLESRWG